jgi:hypothetical protein
LANNLWFGFAFFTVLKVAKASKARKWESITNTQWGCRMRKITLVLSVALLLGFSTLALADLVPYEGGLLYDTDLGITWLKDANFAKTSGYDSDGWMTWGEATLWASTLDYGGSTEWRLPTIAEMYHLFYTEGVMETSPGFSSNVLISYWSSDLAPTSGYAMVFHFGGTGTSPGTSHEGNMKDFDPAWAVFTGKPSTSPVPEPSTMILLGLGVLGLLGWRWDRK